MPKRLSTLLLVMLFSILMTKSIAQEVVSPNFVIRGDNLSGGSGTSNSTTYSITADLNPFSDIATTTNFKQKVGYNPRIEANTPNAATLQNLDNYYDRLRIIIDTSGNPTDTLYAVIASSDNFFTFSYVQNDGTLGATLGTEDYRDYISWGDVNGSYILGLSQNTTYKVRVKALNGDFTETGYSTDSNEATTNVPFVNMAVSHSMLSLGTLNINSISETSTMEVTVNTNSYTGYQVYISDQGNGSFGGLYNGVGNIILSADMVLTAGVEGYGAQANSLSANVSPTYAVAGNSIGSLQTSIVPLFSNTLSVTEEKATVLFKATMSPTTIAGEYTDIVYYTITPSL